MKKARVMLIISMAVFGTIGLFVKNINLPSGEIALYRAVLASVLIGLFLLFKGEKVSVKDMKKELLLLLLSWSPQ